MERVTGKKEIKLELKKSTFKDDENGDVHDEQKILFPFQVENKFQDCLRS